MLDFFKHDYGKVEPMFKTAEYIIEAPKPVIIKRQTTQNKVKKTLHMVKARQMRGAKDDLYTNFKKHRSWLDD